MAHWKTISEHEHRSERLNRLCKMKKFTDNFLLSRRNPFVFNDLPFNKINKSTKIVTNVNHFNTNSYIVPE